MVVPDSFLDQRFCNNPLAIDHPNVRFYAGMPLVNSDGCALGTLCVIDHHPRELMPDQLASLKALARQVVAQLLRKKLRESTEIGMALLMAKNAVEAASSSRRVFLSNMSHEIRTPLTAIIGFAEAALEKTASPMLETITKNANHLLHVINEILDLAKIDSGVINLETASFSLVFLVEEVRVLLSPRIAEKELSLFIKYEWTLPYLIAGDPLRLKQVLFNLVGNAIKFTHQGRSTSFPGNHEPQARPSVLPGGRSVTLLEGPVQTKRHSRGLST